tara:strand:- start:127 stop:543 length:417 start_codon:yes stop_codon:yes gene_type:complete
MKKTVLVDMSATLIHHGHIRLLKKAKELGDVIVALTSDEEIIKYKGYTPELNYEQRKEILDSIIYVDRIIKSPWLINNKFFVDSGADFLIHGNDNSNEVDKDKLILFERTKGISSSLIRSRVARTILMKAGLDTNLEK